MGDATYQWDAAAGAFVPFTGDEDAAGVEVFDVATLRSIAAQGSEAGYAADVVAAAVALVAGPQPLEPAHVLGGPGLAVDRPVWLLECSCGRKFEHPDLLGVQLLGSGHLVAEDAAFLLTLTVALPPGRDPAEITEALMRTVDVWGVAVTVHSIEGGPS